MPLRLGLVGRGRWGKKIEQTLLTFDGVSVVPIARDEKSTPLIDGVLIATDSANHADAALPYIDAGVATFIEKPMATTVADAERIAAAARRSGAPVFVGHIYLYHPAFMAVLDELPALGAVRYLLFEGMNENPRKGSSVLWDWLPHHLSMARALLRREPTSVETWGLSGAAALQAAVSRFQFGTVPLISTISWMSPIPRRHVTIACEQGTIIFDDAAERRLALYDTSGTVSYPYYDKTLPLTREIGAFLKMVGSRAPDTSHFETGVAIAVQIAAAERSLAEGGRVVAI